MFLKRMYWYIYRYSAVEKDFVFPFDLDPGPWTLDPARQGARVLAGHLLSRTSRPGTIIHVGT